jgi:hypothetical protein
LQADKIVFNKPLDLIDAVKALSSIRDSIDVSLIKDNYFYVFIKDNFDLYVEPIPDIEVYWTANMLNVDDRQAVICLMEYPGFWDSLKDILYYNKINNYKRYSVFTKNDLMGSGSRVWEDYIGKNEEEAKEFYRDILMVEDVISVIKMDDEEEE